MISLNMDAIHNNTIFGNYRDCNANRRMDKSYPNRLAIDSLNTSSISDIYMAVDRNKDAPSSLRIL
jgi:hypothetical protein